MQLQRVAALAVVLVGLALSSGCATMAHGTRQNVILNSDPPGAQVFVGRELLGTTPLVANFWRGSRVLLRFEMAGYEPQDVPLKRSASAMVAVDAAVALDPMKMQGMDHADAGVYIGSSALALGMTLGPDLVTGAAFKFPNVVTATLRRKR